MCGLEQWEGGAFPSILGGALSLYWKISLLQGGCGNQGLK